MKIEVHADADSLAREAARLMATEAGQPLQITAHLRIQKEFRATCLSCQLLNDIRFMSVRYCSVVRQAQ
jgi:hypothetical protein